MSANSCMCVCMFAFALDVCFCTRNKRISSAFDHILYVLYVKPHIYVKPHTQMYGCLHLHSRQKCLACI